MSEAMGSSQDTGSAQGADFGRGHCRIEPASWRGINPEMACGRPQPSTQCTGHSRNVGSVSSLIPPCLGSSGSEWESDIHPSGTKAAAV